MGANLQKLNVQAGGRLRHEKNALIHSFSVRVSLSKDGGWKYLQYVRPNGMPVWGDSKTNYVSRLSHFSSAQRLCRELFSSAQFPPGVRVQFYKQFYQPERGQLTKVSEKSIKDSTVQKPHSF